MATTIPSLDKLTHIISRMPSIGERTAMRLALYLFNSDDAYLEDFAETILSLHKNIKTCRECFALSESEVCLICSNEKRNKKQICVVESYPDMLAIEKTEEYNGIYHILGGLINPLKGVGIGDVKIRELVERCTKNSNQSNSDNIEEIILAFSSSLESETTANYIFKTLKESLSKENISPVKITRITYGISLGSDIENADTRSLSRSLLDRLDMDI